MIGVQQVLLPLRRAFAGDEVVWRPRAAHNDLNPGEMARGHLVPVLIFLHFFVVDEMSDVYQHAPGVNLAAAYVLVQRRKDLVDLNGEGPGLGLALTLADS